VRSRYARRLCGRYRRAGSSPIPTARTHTPSAESDEERDRDRPRFSVTGPPCDARESVRAEGFRANGTGSFPLGEPAGLYVLAVLRRESFPLERDRSVRVRRRKAASPKLHVLREIAPQEANETVLRELPDVRELVADERRERALIDGRRDPDATTERDRHDIREQQRPHPPRIAEAHRRASVCNVVVELRRNLHLKSALNHDRCHHGRLRRAAAASKA